MFALITAALEAGNTDEAAALTLSSQIADLLTAGGTVNHFSSLIYEAVRGSADAGLKVLDAVKLQEWWMVTLLRRADGSWSAEIHGHHGYAPSPGAAMLSAALKLEQDLRKSSGVL